MYIDKYEEHVADSAPCASRWDGFDRGDTDANLEPTDAFVDTLSPLQDASTHELVLELIDPLASTTPASPPGRSFQSICCNHA